MKKIKFELEFDEEKLGKDWMNILRITNLNSVK